MCVEMSLILNSIPVIIRMHCVYHISILMEVCDLGFRVLEKCLLPDSAVSNLGQTS